MIFWFTIASLKNYIDVNDVHLGPIIISLTIVGGYATHKRIIKRRGDCEVPAQPGEILFAITFIYYMVMTTLFQTDPAFNFDLTPPKHFYLFIEGLAVIFGGTEVWDLFRKMEEGEPEVIEEE